MSFMKFLLLPSSPAAVEYVPGWHLLQNEDAPAPKLVEYVPLIHKVQEDELVDPDLGNVATSQEK